MSFLVCAKGNTRDFKGILLIHSLIKQILKVYYELGNISGMLGLQSVKLWCSPLSSFPIWQEKSWVHITVV